MHHFFDLRYFYAYLKPLEPNLVLDLFANEIKLLVQTPHQSISRYFKCGLMEPDWSPLPWHLKEVFLTLQTSHLHILQQHPLP